MKQCPKCEKKYDPTWHACLECNVRLIDVLDEIPKNTESQELPVTKPDEAGPILMFSILALFGGLVVFGYQVFLYLKNGSGTSISLIDTALLLAPNNSWLNYPADWVGVHQVLSGIPLSGCLIITPVLMLVIYCGVIKQ